MPDTNTVDISVPIDARFASALDDAATREKAGRLVSEMLREASLQKLFATLDAFSAEATRRGLTDEILDAELAAYNAERREASTPPKT